MGEHRLNPAPREYARFVSLSRRTRRGATSAPEANSPREVEDWLIREAGKIDDFLLLTEEFFWRIRATGAPLDRASLHVGTLHPQISGYAWNWLSSDGILDEVIVDQRSRAEDAFRRNPLFLVFESGEVVRGDPSSPRDRARFPLFRDLHKQGVADYIARPIGRGGAHYNAATIGTFQESGFTTVQAEAIHRLFDLFALHADRHIQSMIARNVVSAYLGRGPGEEVLKGAISRGSGRPIRAVIWASDLRGFSDRADRLAPEETTSMLNRYFEVMSGAVMAEGGEVLKFIGDGMLAVFPTDVMGEADAALRALSAARNALTETDAVNAAPPADIPKAAMPLRSGIGLHLGDAFFGNVGAPERLDFTVIGRAVNETARIEALTKEIGRPILLSEAVASLLTETLEDVGYRQLRGVAAPMRLFAG